MHCRSIPPFAVFAVLGCLGSCSLLPDSGGAPHGLAVETAAPTADAKQAVEATAHEQGAAGGPQEPEARVAVFAFWKDPDFQRRFAESYLYETDIEPRMTSSERELMEEVMGLIGEDQVDKAMSRLRSRQSEGASAVIDFTLGNLLFQRDQLAEAAKEYEVAVRKTPKFRRAWKNLGLIRVRLGEYPVAANAFVRVIELGGGDGLTYGLLAFAHSNAEDHVAAESAYRLAAMMDPATLDWRMGLARTFFKQQRYGEAASLCGALIDKFPERSDLWMLQANAYVGLKDVEKAAQNLEFVDELGKASFDSLALLGDIYINESLFDLGAKAYLRAIRIDEKGDAKRAMVAASQLVARSAYAEGGELLQGIEAAYGAKLDDVGRKDLLKLRARLAVATGQGDEEAKLLEQIIAMDPLDGNSLILLGKYHGRIDDLEKAGFYLDQAAQIEAFAVDAKVQHGMLLASKGDYEKALPLLRSAQQLKPQDHVQGLLQDLERRVRSR